MGNKFIKNAAKALADAQAENEELKRKIRALEEDNNSLRGVSCRKCRHLRASTTPPQSPSSRSSSSASSCSPTKSYMSPTAASEAKTAAPSNTTTPATPSQTAKTIIVNDEPYTYRDGTIVSTKLDPNARFLRDTDSTLTKRWLKRQSHPRAQFDYRRYQTKGKQDADSPDSEGDDGWPVGSGWRANKSAGLDNNFYTANDDPSDGQLSGPECETVGGDSRSSANPSTRPPPEYMPLDETELGIRSGLADEGWTRSGCLAHIYINNEKGMNMLRRAHSIARESFWHAAKVRWPKMWEAHFKDGPGLVKTGYSELELYTGTWSWAREIKRELEAFSQLRNCVCHPRALDRPRQYEIYLTIAHRLVVKLDDERRAMKIRKLRDTLRREAERTLDDLRARAHLAETPLSGSVEWKIQHERLLSSICSQTDTSNYHPDVVRAAKKWASRCGDRD
ncbi:hypothetical protein B0H63DRAFT_524852 [Podospora didyma]|uniref:Uncharacterized protein n=1 Tax=Podospora didyma TaxID=330526 RepID=A0AAE0NCF9_9PEZI|nr:hypothetical protein B0H63DRAFT_524852 [Podospora didyma]